VGDFHPLLYAGLSRRFHYVPLFSCFVPLKALRFNVKAPLPLAKAIVTAGGVALDEIDPRTLMSKKIPGLYFCGEVMDIDADTGGYNLQAAFSTGFMAGESVAGYAKSLSL